MLTNNDEKHMAERVWRQPKIKPEEVEAKVAERLAAQAANAETVNHPAHYQFPNGVETIDLAEQLNFNRGNAVKYLCRAGRKTAEELDDLHKARWYCDREIQRIRNAQALIGGK